MKKYAVVLAAGKGTRMKSEKPKVVHEVLYKPMINHVVDELKALGVDETIVVVGHGAEQVEAIVEGVTFVHQKEQLGTGHAVLQAKDILGDKEGLTLVLNGDAPLIRKETLQGFIDYHQEHQNQATIMSADCDTSTHYGRVIKEDGQVKGIVEFKDLLDCQRDITEMNTGEYCFDNQALFNALSKVTNQNAQNEYYVTDVIGIMDGQGLRVDAYKIDDFNEVGGINDRLALAEATQILRDRINREHLLNGVNIVDPSNTYIGRDVVIGVDTTIEPGCIIKGKTVIGNNCHIGPYCEFTNMEIKDNVEIKFSVLSDSIIENGADIGPYARLRTNCHIGENAHLGNFVEMKKAIFGKGSKASHLTYVGDAEVGEDVNFGCGTITSNYDGKNKSLTKIEDHVFIGCNTNLVAPVTVRKNAYIAAGSTITKEVEEDAMAIARARQVNKQGYSKVLEEIRMKEYEKRKNKK
ncbi:MAG: bifunctional UDP-N-acetylglucosamine diphosphorylase/glucosamine-1-phosphate N-acetyltransferase GlmU [Longibaculum muris]|uniref:Bifunctional protein GlmU n=1 Tax=Longibaculum muris TaxID=1796628 RepID=A0A4R3YZ54_9FIRM|nr:bifunctional UDP-N-acetylglucosamine diphosphorylase/glucosamine-1-phosphate N-acetyltransferase GlmU [Longibaculum muris]KXU40894.1 UDP-N-acetylglucosamine diphosphorylase/glucosamine-1-phosphate N-acetyltransferase [Candidatus Stoquefichus sp. KLE1796]MBS5369316.1 bifunctional UDP-N-acetylglucosamine diphosphorylase/glucosamine-1-phosphate N-acetyltransferase GlmU [Coprobacillus cateniformis]MCR1887982.1 bifunctional UDP-N-acetylglucosamine diphosphorylase/glucosamine-1-phosphate N-acetyltr